MNDNKQYTITVDVLPEEEIATAEVIKNPWATFVKFILTDDKPNANKQRVPKEEFKNLIQSGIYMPIKMAEGEIKGHKEAFPIGVITQLKEVGDQIIGLAALWSLERKNDVNLIKDLYNKKYPLNLSWEIKYETAEISPEGVEDLHGTTLVGLSLVGLPSYAGRTPILAVASDRVGEITTLISELKISDDAKIKLTEEVQAATSEYKKEEASLDAELQKQYDDALAKVQELAEKLTQAEADLLAKQEEVVTKETELASLKEYKANAEKSVADAQKISEIKSKFTAAGIKREDNYFDEHRDTLLAMDPGQVDFMLQEIIAFSSQQSASAEVKKTIPVPDMPGSDSGSYTPKELAEALRNRKQ